MLECEEAATAQTNRACEDRKQLRITWPRLLRGQAEAGIGGQRGVAWGKAREAGYKEVLGW